MNRLVLALLALLAGLVTQTAPAHARISGDVGAQVTVQQAGSGEVSAEVRQSGCRPVAARVLRVAVNPCAIPQRISLTATVLIGSDRARE